MDKKELRMEFTGSGGEYFRIWIVNIALSILTLGIFSAWAKVRRLQYFYRNTRLDNSSFDYHGTPIAILKGRIIGILLFGIYYLASSLWPLAGLGVWLAIAVVMPLLLVLSLRFRLYNTSYRGLRFGFHGSVKSGYFNFLFLPILTLLSFYILAPFAHQRIKAYQHNNTQFGQTPFQFDAKVGSFYKIYTIALLVFLGGFVSGIALIFGGIGMPNISQDGKPPITFIVGIYGAMIVIMALVTPYFVANMQNLIWNNTRIGDTRIRSEMEVLGLARVMFSNMLGIILTLGLFTPFASVRLLRYRLSRVVLIPADEMAAFVANAQQQTAAVGEETAGMFDVEIGL